MVYFINGLPIAVTEFKNPINGKTDILQAYNRLQTYKFYLYTIVKRVRNAI